MAQELPFLHLEITSKCTLACPACPRTYAKGEYPVTDLPLIAIENIKSSGLRYVDISLCGAHGDPIYHRQFHELLRLLTEFSGTPPIMIATNGSHRSREWWSETAKILRRGDRVVFGIDGLADTSPIYRRNSDWDSIMTAIETLRTESAAWIHWQWILFRHNEHQMAEAAATARRLGIDSFLLIQSSRRYEMGAEMPTVSLPQAEAQFRKAYDLSTL